FGTRCNRSEIEPVSRGIQPRNDITILHANPKRRVERRVRWLEVPLNVERVRTNPSHRNRRTNKTQSTCIGNYGVERYGYEVRRIGAIQCDMERLAVRVREVDLTRNQRAR